jgi:hypothetical protein
VLIIWTIAETLFLPLNRQKRPVGQWHSNTHNFLMEVTLHGKPDRKNTDSVWQDFCFCAGEHPLITNSQYAFMKILFLPVILFLSFCVPSSAQQSGRPVNFVAIETVDSTIAKETLYLNGVEWIGKHFNNGQGQF